jgi:hypothetical protein
MDDTYTNGYSTIPPIECVVGAKSNPNARRLTLKECVEMSRHQTATLLRLLRLNWHLQQPKVQPVQPESIPCACVSHDATDCARIRDGLSTDDPRYERRKCECVCHSTDTDDE